MKIQIASDLHLEFLERKWPDERLIEPAPGAGLLVLAGDIGNGVDALSHFANWPVPVVYLAGNHEYYGHPLPAMKDKIRRECVKLGITFLDNEVVTFGEVRVLGATLWTDYCLPRLNRKQSQLMEEAALRINDHFQIRMGRHKFTPADALALHNGSRAWIVDELVRPWDGQTVVVTHHGCHPLSVHPRYIGYPLNAAFVSDLSDLMPGVDLWLHGHVHDSLDYAVGRCRVVTNPAGYVKNRQSANLVSEFEFENPAFNRAFVVEV
jgi:predicted phosphodiesterase